MKGSIVKLTTLLILTSLKRVKVHITRIRYDFNLPGCLRKESSFSKASVKVLVRVSVSVSVSVSVFPSALEEIALRNFRLRSGQKFCCLRRQSRRVSKFLAEKKEILAYFLTGLDSFAYFSHQGEK